MIACPSCGRENPADAKFCNTCGTPLNAAPAAATRKERKFATALFADLVGSTALAEREDPEVVQSVVGRTFDRLAQEIQRYEGLLEKFMGDAVLAVFGVPKSHEDDAERAVRAALEMQAILSELNRGFAAEGKPTLGMRIGVEAGEVLVDLERASGAGARDRMLTGDAVNTAARLQAAAEPSQIVVGPSVYAATKEVIEYQQVEPLTLKGKAEPVPAWRTLRIKARTRGERPRLGMEARLVGRDEELAVLKQTFHRVQTDSRPALVTVIGPAGVGKSRLISELEGYVEGLKENAYWRRGRCLAYANTAYSALADAIKAQCEIFEDDSAEGAAGKAEAAVRDLFGDDSVAPQLRALVGAGETRDMSREELFEAWRRFLERLAARYPLVLVLDDIHWADDGLLDFIDHVADWAQGPIMVVATARAELLEKRPTWGGGKRNATSIYLDPLSSAEGEAMLDDLLPGPIQPELKRTIVERSEGNPLYVEEIVRKLIDDGVLRATEASKWEVARPVAGIDLPRSVQGLIAARLDGLADDEKAVLQDAAVVGRVFWVGALVELTGRPMAEVRDALGRLRVKELVVPHEPSSFRDEQEFAFRHGLIRDGAYDSLPKSLRADKHLGIARWAADRAGDRVEEIAELIATHEIEAVRYLDELGERRPEVERTAFEHAWAAARRTSALSLAAESTRWYREAERLADRLDIPLAERAQLIREHTSASYGPDAVAESERVARRAVEAYKALGDARGMGWATAHVVMPLMQQGRDEEAEAAGRDAIEALEPLGDSAELAHALHRLGWFLWRRGRAADGDPLLRRAITMANQVQDVHVLAEATQTLALCLRAEGKLAEGYALMEEAFRLAKEAGDNMNLMRAYNNLANVRHDVQGPQRAVEVPREGLEMALRSGATAPAAYIAGTLAYMEKDLGRLSEAEEHGLLAVSLGQRVGDEPITGQWQMELATVVLMRGRLDEAVALRDQSATIIAATPEPQAAGTLPLFDGYLALSRRDQAAASERFAEAADQVRAHNNVDGLPEIFADCARAFLLFGDRDRAETYRDLETSTDSIEAAVFAANVRGLLEPDPARAIDLLRDAVAEFERLGMRLYAGRSMVDLGRAMAQAGQDPRGVLERARDLLTECDARLFLFEVDEVTAD
jgi:class 3 adenylate cyclase/tetratricopeptide (TPR) repeat protein